MGLFSRSSSKRTPKEPHPDTQLVDPQSLREGLRWIIDAWEADVFRITDRQAWAARQQEPSHAEFVEELAHWLEYEVVHDGGAIRELSSYEDNLSVEIGETVRDADPDLADALMALDDEQGGIMGLASPSVDFANRLCYAARIGPDAVREEVEEVVRAAKEKIEGVLSLAPEKPALGADEKAQDAAASSTLSDPVTSTDTSAPVSSNPEATESKAQ